MSIVGLTGQTNSENQSRQSIPMESSGLPPNDLFAWMWNAWSSLTASSRRILWTALIVNWVAYGFLFSNLTLNHDGFGAITAGGSYHRGTGRWIGDLIYINILGAHEVIWLYGLAGMVLFIAAAFSICRTLDITDTSTRLIVVLCYTLFPYTCNYYAYAFYVPIYGFAALAAVYAVECAQKPRVRWNALGSVLLALSLASYQAFLATALTLVCLSMAVRLARADRQSRVLQIIAHALMPQVIMVVGGALIYALSVRASTAWFGVALTDYQGANSMLGVNYDSLLRGVRVAIQGTYNFLGYLDPNFHHGYENPHFTGWSKIVCAVIGLVAIWNLLRRSAAWTGAIAGAIFFVLALIAPRSVQILHPDANYHELALGAYSVYLAGTFAIALRSSAGALRVALQAIVVVLLAVFIHANNVAALSLTLDYQATLHWANRVLARVEAHPQYGNLKYPALKRFIFIGDGYQISQWHYRGRPFLSSVGISDGIPGIVFGSLFQLLRVNATVYGISTENHERALAYAASHGAWPAEDSITVLDDGTIVVVLENESVLRQAPGK